MISNFVNPDDTRSFILENLADFRASINADFSCLFVTTAVDGLKQLEYVLRKGKYNAVTTSGHLDKYPDLKELDENIFRTVKAASPASRIYRTSTDAQATFDFITPIEDVVRQCEADYAISPW